MLNISIKTIIIDYFIKSSAGILLVSSAAWCEENTDYEFESGFIVGSKENADLSRFSVSAVSEGTYSLDVYTNDKWQGRHDLQVKEIAKDRLGICYSEKMLYAFGINAEKLNSGAAPDENTCLPLNEWNNSPQVIDSLKASTLQLFITIPQVYLLNTGRYISADNWDHGITALNVSYMANYYHSRQTDYGSNDDDTFYLTTNSGLSFKGWLLKQEGNYSWQRNGRKGWKSNQTYLQRPVAAINSKFTAGQFATEGDILESVRLRGLKLTTDGNMYPDGTTNFAPFIRGIAQSNALVTVRQVGLVIYQTSVPAGPFELTDINPSGYGNDLEVTIKEADGSESTFSVPYTSSNKLVRPGFFRYDINAGKADYDGLNYHPNMMQGSLQYGLNNFLTLYSGANISEDYAAWLAGTGLNTPVGTFSLDATHARTEFKHNTAQGENYQFSFTQIYPGTNTNLYLSYYRRSGRDYYAVNDALYSINAERHNDFTGNYREKQGFIYSVNQSFAENFGSLYLTGRISDYWDSDRQDKQYQFSYNNSFDKLSYSLGFMRTYSDDREKGYNDSINLNLNYPLSFGDGYRATMTSNTWIDNKRFGSSQIGVNGSLDAGNTLTYGVSTAVMKDNNYAASLNGGYRNAVSNLNANYSYGRKYRQFGMGASGSVVAHSGGITFTPEISGTMVLAEAENAQGASLLGFPASRFDKSGYVLMPYVRPYRVNTIEIDPKGSSEDVAFQNTSANIAPYEGAIVKVKFGTKIEKNIMYIVRRTDGRPLPFGTEVTDLKGNAIGVVSQGSVVLINDENATQGVVRLENETCTFPLDLSKRQNTLCQ